jgi:hypothetical protein
MRVVIAALLIAALAAGCDDSTERGYSAEKFKRCIEREHADVITLTRGKGFTVALLWWPTFAEWVYFYKTAEAASGERARLRTATTRNRRVLRQLLRTSEQTPWYLRLHKRTGFLPSKAAWSERGSSPRAARPAV